MEYAKLFEPITINGCTIPNRMAVTAMVTDLCTEDGSATERYVKYHEEKAKGGFGLIITEDYAVSLHAGGYKYVARLYKDEQIEGHRQMTDAVHKHGTKIFAQLYHAGRQANEFANGGMEPVAPSPMPSPWNRQMPRELTIDEIHEIVADFGATARRAKAAGFDGVEIHAGNGYLIAGFMSFYENKRTDEYGGCFTNRMRFAREVYESVRAAVGPDFPVGIRFSAQEDTLSGRTIAESRMVAKEFERWGIDIINCSNGVYCSHQPGQVSSTLAPHAWTIGNAAELKKVVDIPVLGVNRITDPLMADQLLELGYCDMVGIARGSLADPHLPNKAKEGKLDQINYCVGCMQGCTGFVARNEPIRCLVNPVLGREAEFTFEPADAAKKVLVIGAGIGGIWAAIAAARRGHDVTVWEARDRIGGQFVSAVYPPGKGDYATYPSFLASQVRELGICLELNKLATAEDVRAFGADKVIVATGAVPKVPALVGIDSPKVLYPEDVLLGRVNPEGRIYVLGGGANGLEVTCHLADLERGDISLVARRYSIADKEDPGRVIALRHFCEERWVHFLLGHSIVRIEDEGVVLSHDGEERLHPCDWIVVAMGYEPVNDLADELADLGDSLVVVGDARSVRDGLEAGRDGLEAGYYA